VTSAPFPRPERDPALPPTPSFNAQHCKRDCVQTEPNPSAGLMPLRSAASAFTKRATSANRSRTTALGSAKQPRTAAIQRASRKAGPSGAHASCIAANHSRLSHPQYGPSPSPPKIIRGTLEGRSRIGENVRGTRCATDDRKPARVGRVAGLPDRDSRVGHVLADAYPAIGVLSD